MHTIAFTGSAAVGLEIIAAAAEVAAGQTHLKRVVAEMGGKNCMIVDADADLDEAVPGDRSRSAFGFAGQKCSAASRVLVHERVADTAAGALAGAVETLRVGQADDFGDRRAAGDRRERATRVERYLALARAAGRARRRGGAACCRRRGWLLRAPTLVARAARPAPAACTRRSSGRCSRSSGSPTSTSRLRRSSTALPLRADRRPVLPQPAHRSQRVAARSPVGNLYVNRAITGAMVGRQPFGGNRLSGTGTKAGGPDYLLQFVDTRVVTENVTRHGLVV